jgi:hypothetical protein
MLAMNNTEEKIKVDEIVESLDEMLTRSHTKALVTRIALLVVLGIGFLYFLGFGNKSLFQYIFAMVMVFASYWLGKSDAKESYEISSIDAFLQLLCEADVQEPGSQEDAVNVGNPDNGGKL